MGWTVRELRRIAPELRARIARGLLPRDRAEKSLGDVEQVALQPVGVAARARARSDVFARVGRPRQLEGESLMLHSMQRKQVLWKT